MIRVTCPACGKTLSAPDEKAGQTGKCACGERIRIPSQLTTKPIPSMPAAISTAPETAASHFTAKANSKLLWLFVPLAGVTGTVLGVVVVLLLVRGNKQEDQQTRAGNPVPP